MTRHRRCAISRSLSRPRYENNRPTNEVDPISVQVMGPSPDERSLQEPDVPSETLQTTTDGPPSSEPNPMKRKDPPVQMVLNTSGASWNLTIKETAREGMPQKRARVDSGPAVSERLSTNTTGKKAGLWAFALPGSSRPQVREDAPREDNEEVSSIASGQSARRSRGWRVTRPLKVQATSRNGRLSRLTLPGPTLKMVWLFPRSNEIIDVSDGQLMKSK
jgi:hypothetical protein